MLLQALEAIFSYFATNFDFSRDIGMDPTCLQEKESTITDPTEIANSFNDYFTSVAEKILNKRKCIGNKLFSDFLKNRMANNFTFEPCTKEEIKSIILSLESSKPHGTNSIPVFILQLLADKSVHT